MINEITKRQEKLKYMTECDQAYTISVLQRDNFDELFDKIDRNAVFLGMSNERDNVMGYSAFYANDIESKEAFLSLFCIKQSYQNIGMGGCLLDKSTEIAKSKGMQSMVLEVLLSDTHVIAFYKKHGFMADGHGVEPSFMRMKKAI